jgi:phosphoribosyl 1,2-cyclic phosphodiesterase
MDVQIFGSSSKGNCYRLMAGSSPILLEAGLPWKEIQRGCGFKTSELAGCLVSHGHQDHARAVPDLLKAGVDCYMSAGTAEALGVSGHRVHIVRPLEQFEIGECIVLPFDAVHDAPEPLNFLLAHKNGIKAVYITDTAYCKYRFRDLTHILIEANYALDLLSQNVQDGTVPVDMKKRLLKTHMSLETCKGFLRANDLSKVEAIYLLHLSDNNSDAERFKREIQELTGKEVYIAGT